MDEPAFASATRLAGEIRDRRIGCLELLDHYLARAERYNPALNAVVAWQLDRDIWWHDFIKDAPARCKPEAMDSEDMLYLL